MTMTLFNNHLVTTAFEARPDLIKAIQDNADTEARISLFNDIADYVLSLTHGSANEPDLKRRKTPHIDPSYDLSPLPKLKQEPVELVIKDLSWSIPVRKKLDLCFTRSGVYGRSSGTTEAFNDSGFEFTDIEFGFWVPVPEKTQVQHNLILMPKDSGFGPKDAPNADSLVITLNTASPKPEAITGSKAEAALQYASDWKSLFKWALHDFTRIINHKIPIVSTDPAVFSSAIKQSQRPNEKAVHVKAFRGSKEGFLFFLSTGILWGFKKPLLYIPLERIVAVSYTNVLQRTFNMVIEVLNSHSADGRSEEIEFSMIDQADYQGIDEKYMKKNRINNESLAEQRKAKLELAENIRAAKERGETENGDVKMEDGIEDEADEAKSMGELEKAEWEQEQRLQDAEDEEEEDYDPGSDGDSDGSGSSSEESEGEEGGGDDDEEAEEEEAEEEEAEEEEEEEPQARPVAPASRVGGWATLNR